MDYSDDRCMYMFTAGQIVRMQATLAGPRASLAASAGAIAPPTGTPTGPWSADTPADDGSEPNALATELYVSDDIWVRNQADGVTLQEHQNPVYRASGPANHVYVLVRNRSCASVNTANVKLYWAKASSALSWPAPWDGSVLSPALMGQLIDTKATGTLAAGASAVLDFAWSPPNPTDYASFGGDASHFCLLSRIETSPTAPYGMTVPETSDLNANVRNNNKIVWKNVTVASDAGGRVGRVSVGPAPNGGPVRLDFTEPTDTAEFRSVFLWGNVEVDLGSDLYLKWYLGGLVGYGVTQIPSTTKIRLAGSGAYIGNLAMDVDDLSTISVEFVPFSDGYFGLRALPDVYYLQVTEKSGSTVIGGQRFTLKTVLPIVED
jgi:hypothetical protein